MTTTEIALRSNGHVAVTERDIVDGWITVVADVAKLSDHIAETDFVPKALRNKPAAIAACILTGRELGIGPMASLKSIHMVQGTPSLSAEYKRARALAAGHQIVIDESTSARCVVRGRRAGAETWVTITWTLDHARRAKLTGKDVWQQYPQRMLQARATSELCDLLFPDATLGLPTTEELEDGGALAFAIGTEAAAEAESNGHAPAEKPAGRTAQRRTRASATPAAPESPPRETGAPAPAQAAAAGLPPLPGEDEVPTSGAGGTAATAPESGEPSSAPSAGDRATPGQIGLIVQHFERLGVEDRDVRLGYTAQIAGLDTLASTKDLTPQEAKAVLDTLARCKDQERLIVLMDQRERAAHAGAEGSQDGPGAGGGDG